MSRRAKVLAVVAFALLLLVAAYDLVRPRYFAAPESKAAPRASTAAIEDVVRSLPLDRNARNPEALEGAEALVTRNLQDSGWAVTPHPIVRVGRGHSWRLPSRAHNLLARRGDRIGPRLVVAHLDTVFGTRGADDNGSGVAVVLELARLLDVRAPASLLVTGEEERGLRGAASWVEEYRDTLPGLEEVYVLDTVGYFSSADGSQQYPPFLGPFAHRRGDFIACLGLHDSRPLCDALLGARERLGVALPLALFTPPRPLGSVLPDMWRSDQAPFWNAGVPAVMLTDTAPFRNPNYHLPSDLPETLDYAALARLTDLLLAALERP